MSDKWERSSDKQKASSNDRWSAAVLFKDRQNSGNYEYFINQFVQHELEPGLNLSFLPS